MTTNSQPSRPVDTSKAHPARVYDWLLGGKDNYPVDEAVGEMLPPEARDAARQNRQFMHRAAAWLATQGVDQFLDIGTGIPTEPNLHQIVQDIVPSAKVVYADNDPIVLRHAEALLVSRPGGVTDYIQADVREPGRILEQARKVLDFEQPIALSLVALLHFVADEARPYELVGQLVDALPSGSYLVLSQLTADFDPLAVQRGVDMYAAGGVTLVPRSRDEVGRFFEGLELTEPGIVQLTRWHPELGVDEVIEGNEAASLYAGVARKA